MSISRIAQAEFDKIVSGRDKSTAGVWAEHAWYGNDDRTFVGVVNRGRGRKPWSSVIIENQPERPYEVVRIRNQISTQEEAQADLVQAMELLSAEPMS